MKNFLFCCMIWKKPRVRPLFFDRKLDKANYIFYAFLFEICRERKGEAYYEGQ